MATLEVPTRPATPFHAGPFVNEPPTDFRREETVRKMRAAIERVRGELGAEHELIIGGKRIRTEDKIQSINPAIPSQVVGVHQKAGREHVEPALQAALEAFRSWSRTPVEERASLLFRVADLLRERKFEFCAWLIFEVSKNWAEADADIAETIDFCEFYAREALRLAYGQVGRVVKSRTLYLVGRTRVHLDRVEGLGHFLELEVVLEDDEPCDSGVREAHALMGRLGIDPSTLIETAYFDLLAKSALERPDNGPTSA